MSSPRPPLPDSTNAFGSILRGLSAVCFLIPVGWWGVRCYYWLRDGYWAEQPLLLDWVCWMSSGACSAITDPSSWVGLAKLVRRAAEVWAGWGFVYLGIALFLLSSPAEKNAAAL